MITLNNNSLVVSANNGGYYEKGAKYIELTDENNNKIFIDKFTAAHIIDFVFHAYKTEDINLVLNRLTTKGDNE